MKQLLCLVVVLLAMISISVQKQSNSLISASAFRPPARPTSFKSVDELYTFLEELREYYDLMSRPR